MMITSKLLLTSLVLIALSGCVLAAYAVARSIASSVSSAVLTNLSTLVERTTVKSPLLPAPTGPAVSTLDTSQTITTTMTVTGSLKIATAIAAYFNAPVSDIVQLHDAGWGYGEIYKLYAFAQASGKTVAQIKALRDAGQGWGDIPKGLNLPAGNHGADI